MKRMNWGGFSALALTLTVFGASAAQAQAISDNSDESQRAEQAYELEQQAKVASQSVRDFSRAAYLYRQAAEARGDSPEAVEDLIMAGTLAYYVGRKGQAISDLAQAGDQALAWGDVVTAAESFLDAAWIAQAEGRNDRALELGRKAERLSNSPLIQRGERVALLSRIAELQDG